MAFDYDFIGFTYNGKHCINDFNIYRTSDGSRYNNNLVPQMTDKAVDVPGGDGQYYFYTQHKARQFSVNIAFDHLTEDKYHEMRQWLDGKGIHDLVFDEAPYKVYSAKVTGTPQLKTICFSEGGQRIYKGEGTIQFTCYYPYAHTPTDSITASGEGGQISPSQTAIVNIIVKKGETVTNSAMASDEGGSFIYNYTSLSSGDKGSIELKLQDSYVFEEDVIINTAQPKLSTSPHSQNQFKIDEFKYQYVLRQDKYVFRVQSAIDSMDGKYINYYQLKNVQNTAEWYKNSGLGFNNDITAIGQNLGDLPAPFKVTKSGQITPGSTFKVANNEIKITNMCYDLEWDSKTGLVIAAAGLNGIKRPVPYTGKSFGTLPVAESNTVEIKGGKLDYSLWYY